VSEGNASLLFVWFSFLMLFLSMVQGNAKAKFDETLEAHVRLGIEKGRSELVCDAFIFSGNTLISLSYS